MGLLPPPGGAPGVRMAAGTLYRVDASSPAAGSQGSWGGDGHATCLPPDVRATRARACHQH